MYCLEGYRIRKNFGSQPPAIRAWWVGVEQQCRAVPFRRSRLIDSSCLRHLWPWICAVTNPGARFPRAGLSARVCLDPHFAWKLAFLFPRPCLLFLPFSLHLNQNFLLHFLPTPSQHFENSVASISATDEKLKLEQTKPKSCCV